MPDHSNLRTSVAAVAAILELQLAGCAKAPLSPEPDIASVEQNTASTCVATLVGHSREGSTRLNGQSFSIVNWNVQKGRDPDWVSDLVHTGDEPDLVILQEAAPNSVGWEKVAPTHYHSFAKGYGSRSIPTGVMTLSTAEPLAECDLVTYEPWIRTRKATLVTEYGLTDTKETLLVVNIHGINFTWGTGALKKQFEQARAVIAEHAGPVLFSGDFNTWRAGRVRMLDDLTQSIGLTRLEYRADHRKRFFGSPLDHIYVRGLDTIDSTTHDLTTSDHNPMSVSFRLMPPTERPLPSP
jgi:endonuclease/exonuclease/phosphatase (EEP) superfamily protein YafD